MYSSPSPYVAGEVDHSDFPAGSEGPRASVSRLRVPARIIVWLLKFGVAAGSARRAEGLRSTLAGVRVQLLTRCDHNQLTTNSQRNDEVIESLHIPIL